MVAAMKTKSLLLWSAILLCAVSCSRGGAKPGAGNKAKPGAARTDTLFEATGLDTVRIDEATVPEAIKALGVTEAEARTFSDGKVELRAPFLVLSFVPPPDGQGPPRLYAIRAVLWEPIYTGKTSKGIGLLDSVERMREVYGDPETVWVSQNHQIHYYPQQGVIFTTKERRDIQPTIYAQARAALGKTDEGTTGSVVTTIRVVRPFTVIQRAETAMVRQQVVSTRPKTDLLVPEF
jgi:hypothetical protein